MTAVIDGFISYRFLRILTRPWHKQDAFKHGIIDKNGVALRKSKDLNKTVEKDSYTLLHRLIFNLKRLLGKIPGGKSQIASYVAAFALIRESEFDENTSRILKLCLIEYVNSIEFKKVDELLLTEEFANSIGPMSSGGEISNFAGLGKTPPSKFGGFSVYPVTFNTYVKLMKGKKKYARWKNYMSSEEAKDVRKYIKSNPKKNVVIQDDTYGSMMILYRHNEV